MQTLKSLLKKADEEGRDPYIAILVSVGAILKRSPTHATGKSSPSIVAIVEV